MTNAPPWCSFLRALTSKFIQEFQEIFRTLQRKSTPNPIRSLRRAFITVGRITGWNSVSVSIKFNAWVAAKAATTNYFIFFISSIISFWYTRETWLFFFPPLLFKNENNMFVRAEHIPHNYQACSSCAFSDWKKKAVKQQRVLCTCLIHQVMSCW